MRRPLLSNEEKNIFRDAMEHVTPYPQAEETTLTPKNTPQEKPHCEPERKTSKKAVFGGAGGDPQKGVFWTLPGFPLLDKLVPVPKKGSKSGVSKGGQKVGIFTHFVNLVKFCITYCIYFLFIDT